MQKCINSKYIKILLILSNYTTLEHLVCTQYLMPQVKVKGLCYAKVIQSQSRNIQFKKYHSAIWFNITAYNILQATVQYYNSWHQCNIYTNFTTGTFVFMLTYCVSHFRAIENSTNVSSKFGELTPINTKTVTKNGVNRLDRCKVNLVKGSTK